MRILIAEDDPTSRRMLTAVLEQGGHEVQVAVNGAEAWAALQAPAAPRLAILDWMMPELEGVEVVRRVRAHATERPPYLIMLTTREEKADVVTALEAGANDYLTKPFNLGELRARIAVGQRLLTAEAALAEKIDELRRTLDEVKTLRGMVPICSSCKKIRDDQGYWQQVETYVHAHTGAEFSHGICPDCMRRLYPEFCDEPDGTPPGSPAGSNEAAG